MTTTGRSDAEGAGSAQQDSGPRRGLRAAAAGLLAAGLFAAGCSSSGPRPIDPSVDLHDPSGTRRAQAVQVVAAGRDLRHVEELIVLLDDPDETVRLQAGAALRSLTGHDTGYRPFLPRAERQAHVESWQAWWRDQGGVAPAARGTP